MVYVTAQKTAKCPVCKKRKKIEIVNTGVYDEKGRLRIICLACLEKEYSKQKESKK